MLFFFNDTATTEIYTLSLHDALPIFYQHVHALPAVHLHLLADNEQRSSEEHTSELQSRPHLVCRLLLEKKQKHMKAITSGPNYSSLLRWHFTSSHTGVPTPPTVTPMC